MSILVNVVERKVPGGEEAGQMKWYGQVVAGAKIPFDKICRQVAHHCMATHADVEGVLKEVLNHLADVLEEGKSAGLNRLGSFRLTAGSTGVEKEEDFTLRLMKSPKVRFVPGKSLKAMLNNLSFIRQKVKVVVVPGECKEEHV